MGEYIEPQTFRLRLTYAYNPLEGWNAESIQSVQTHAKKRT